MAATQMKLFLVLSLGFLGISFLITGCGKSEEAASISELEQAFQLKQSAAASAPAAPAGGRDHVQQTVGEAVSAMKTNGYAEAFAALRSIQAAPDLTFEQYTAIANARLAVEKQLAERAVAGDPTAQRAVETIKRMGR